MKYLLLLCSIFSFGIQLQAQTKYWVFFKDKGANFTQKLTSPDKFLSEEALAIRKQKNIHLSVSDLPVEQAYISQIQQIGIDVLSQSRWLNAVAVDMPESVHELVANMNFVKTIQPIKALQYTRHKSLENHSINDRIYQVAKNNLNYGKAGLQNEMINISALHDQGFTGKGIRIAVLDAGFYAVNTLDIFDSLRSDGRIIAAYDFVLKNDTTLYNEDNHGMQVLSTISANLPGEMVGTAPHASVLLARTEEARTETQQEEHNWVRAVEWADSIGVDIIHTSLGYHDFDNDSEDYEYEDLDGKTAIITRAAAMAARKGILVTTSAGNEGSYRWRHITAPCDADSILCIGSVNKNGIYSSFSSIGPTADGRVKPDVVAMGTASIVGGTRNNITVGNGTSFAAPIVSGMVACIRQAHPDRSTMDIIQAIRLSGNKYTTPDEKYGFGIPDAGFADSLLTHVEDLSSVIIQAKPTPSLSSTPGEITFTKNPKSSVKVGNGILNVSSPETIQDIYIMFGKQKLVFGEDDYKQGVNQATYNMKYFLKGDYYVYIKTDQYEERIQFSY